MFLRFAFGWFFGYVLILFLTKGLDASANYALLSGWWCSTALVRGTKGSKWEWIAAVVVAFCLSACNLVFGLKTNLLNESNFFRLITGAILAASPISAALFLDFLSRAFAFFEKKAVKERTVM